MSGVPTPGRLLAAALVVALLAPAAAAAEFLARPGAVLQGLDKITARVSKLDVRNGDAVRFHGLTIRVEACNVRPPEEPPEAAAFLVIRDAGADAAEPPLYRGWMFASSPAVSPLEHPVYDVRVLACLDS